jgi:hypothetical protein
MKERRMLGVVKCFGTGFEVVEEVLGREWRGWAKARQRL